MGRTIRGRAFYEDWIVVKDGDVYDDCLFEDCVMVREGGKSAAAIIHSTAMGCTFVGPGWPAELRRVPPFRATKSDEPEVIEARVTKSITGPRPRRRWFNLGRKRN